MLLVTTQIQSLVATKKILILRLTAAGWKLDIECSLKVVVLNEYVINLEMTQWEESIRVPAGVLLCTSSSTLQGFLV